MSAYIALGCIITESFVSFILNLAFYVFPHVARAHEKQNGGTLFVFVSRSPAHEDN